MPRSISASPSSIRNLSDNLDVAANIFLGREPRRFGVIDSRRIYAESAKYLKLVGLDISPRTIVSTMPIGRQQMIEIAKALSVNARILIMDEPTSSLSERETEALFAVINDLRSKGVSIVYISHRLGEVNQLADRVVVLRDGENAGNLSKEEINHDSMVRLMVGRDVSQFYHHESHTPGEAVLEVEDLLVPGRQDCPLNFKVHEFEIVGVSGLVGAGRTEMLRVLFGIDNSLGGTIKVNGEHVQFKSPLDAMNAGMALVPENRKAQGLFLEMALRENVSLAGLRRHRKLNCFINSSQENDVTAEMIRKLNIRTPSAEQIVQYLSGGNQQKVVLGKWLSLRPAVLLLDEPTRGIDVGAKEEIYILMEELSQQGVGILFVSSEMEEILGLSDRALVMHEGRITGELQREQLSEEAVMHLATGNVEAA